MGIRTGAMKSLGRTLGSVQKYWTEFQEILELFTKQSTAKWNKSNENINGSMQKKHNSSSNSLELCLFCIKLSLIENI